MCWIENVQWYEEDCFEIYLYDVEDCGIWIGDWVGIELCVGQIVLCVWVFDCMQLGVVYMMFYFFELGVNVIMMDSFDWVMNCFEYKVMVVQVMLVV